MNGQKLYLYAFAAAAGAITFFDIKECQHLPWPPRLVKTAVAFALLEIFSVFQEELAGVMAIGLVIAIFVKQGWISDCQNGDATSQPQATNFIGAQLAGQQPQSYSQFAPAGAPSQGPSALNPQPSTTPNQQTPSPQGSGGSKNPSGNLGPSIIPKLPKLKPVTKPPASQPPLGAIAPNCRKYKGNHCCPKGTTLHLNFTGNNWCQ